MSSVDKKFIHRYNLYMEVAFLKAFQLWKLEPNVSFARILKETLQKSNLWPSEDATREQVLNYMLRYIQVSISMQTACYCYEIIKSTGLDQSSQSLKNKLKSIKTVIDVDNKEKTTNALQMLKIIREAFAHNDDSESVSNWSMDENLKIHIQSKMDRAGNRHNITMSFAELSSFIQTCLTNLIDLNGSVTDLFVNGKKIEEKNKKQRQLIPEQIGKHVKEINKETNEHENSTELQLQALCNCFAEDFFHGDVIKRLSSPYRPNFVLMVYPFKFNCFNHIMDMRTFNKGLYHLSLHYKSLEQWFSSIFNKEKEDENMTCDEMTYLFYFFGSGKIDSVFIGNILFSIFSFERFANVESLFADTGLDINRIRNSVMHGRFYYNHNKGFDFYDGRNNNDLEYIGTLQISKIIKVSQELMHDYLEEITTDEV